MPQQPHLIASRSYHEDIAIYWMDYNHVPTPLDAFQHSKHSNNTFPERSGLSLSDDEEEEDQIHPNTNGDHDGDIHMKQGQHRRLNRKRKTRSGSDRDDRSYPTKRQKVQYTAPNYPDLDADEFENCMDIEVGAGNGYLIAVGQTSTKTKTGWALAFNPQHSGMFLTGNSDGSIACWDLNMVDNKQSMTMHGKFKQNCKNAASPEVYMKDSKVWNMDIILPIESLGILIFPHFQCTSRFEADRSMMGRHSSPDSEQMSICGLRNLKNMEIGEDSPRQLSRIRT